MHDRIADPWGSRTPVARGTDWPERVDMHLEDGVAPDEVDRWVQTASILHSDGDAMDIAVKDGRIAGVRGRGIDRVNRGRLGPKDLFGWQANNAPDRLRRPLIRRDGELRECGWDTAMDAVTGRAKTLLSESGPGSIGFYTSGQLFLEDYYTLAVLARAGIGTNHLDGNTRLCTATAGEALKESFGCDGQPASYSDVNECDTLFLVGHNVAETQPVLWMRMLDRLEGPDPPKLIVVDPRLTQAVQRADVHLALKGGTNYALLAAIVHELISTGRVDQEYVGAHTVGFDELEQKTKEMTPDRAAGICGVPAEQIKEAAALLGSGQRLLSTVLQGVYQSHLATASACMVNNVNLLRGMLGKPGCGVLQMNGQPTAENTRETGANGDLPGFRNWQNDAHVEELARIWNVDPLQIPHYAPPTHAMQIFRYAEQGTIRFLWISATNPAVSLPELHRIRDILGDERLFVVVQDLFMTETAEFADVVLPAATWGEKAGTFTNADRTIHLSEKAVEPPGDAKADLDIFLDFARRMDLRDKDGAPLIKWDDAESAYRAWQECSRGRPCDYSGISYDDLRDGSGIQWGGERLYAEGRFWSAPDYCETWGKDLLTGASFEEAEYRSLNPDAKAILRAGDWTEPHEPPSDEYPFQLTTGRTIYHFHTRTKTGRAPELQDAAPDVWVELAEADAEALGLEEGDIAEIESPRGKVRAPVRVKRGREGIVFVPFHYGYWDTGKQQRDRAANELTITDWDPVSKQPIYKTAAVRVTKAETGERVVRSSPVGESKVA